MPHHKRFLQHLMFLFLPMLIFAGNTGKIAGIVNDKANGEPLIGVNILVQGTMLGATSDLDGTFFILNVPPGDYTVEAQYIGYNNMRFEHVKVNADLTTELDIVMQETVLELSEDIVVVAERDLVIKDLTATTATVGSEQLATLPVTEVSEALQLQAGYVDGHVRGGRSGEVAYWIDGMPVTDKYDGGTVVDVNKDMVEELQFISGAFNAEYGQAMSGIVNITTKEPTENFGGSITLYAGDYFSQHSGSPQSLIAGPPVDIGEDVYWNLNNFDPTNIYNAEGGIYGTIIPGRLSYYVNARYIYFGGWLYGKREFNPQNISYTDNTGYHIARDSSGLGDGEYVPMNWNRKMYVQGKLIYNITPQMKVFYSYIRDDVHYEEYDRNYKLDPDGNPDQFRVGDSHIAKLTQSLNPSTYYDLGFSFFKKDYQKYVYEDPFDLRYVHPIINDAQQPYSFKSGGTNNQYFTRQTKTYLGKLDLTSQVTKQHLLKIGVEARFNDLNYDDITLRPPLGDNLDLATGNPYMYEFPDGTPIPREYLELPGLETPYHSQYRHKPVEFSAYIQDKMEFHDLIVNLGVRIDYFRPDGVILADPSDPDVYNPINPAHIFKPDGTPYTLAERLQFWYLPASNKTKISPRLGVSFPVTETGMVYFSYGQFFQIPNYELLYRNPQFKLGTGIGNQGTIGNADLKPEFTTSGEVGMKQQLGAESVLDVTIYFRDVRDLTGTRADEILIYGGSASYSKLVNSDFGFIKGIILSLRNRFTQGFNYTVDYTFQIAKGTASDPDAAQKALAAGNQPNIQMVPLAWDQLHTVNATASWVAQSWGISLIGNFGSGLPYTPRATSDVSALRENSGLKPVSMNVDMRVYKDFDLFNTKLTFFLRVFNLLDRLNQLNVYDDSGRADFTTDLSRTRSQNPALYINTLEDWYNNASYYAEPRRIELGVMINF
jgi:outer membrane receptor protein involved in Fe transport